MSFLDNIKRQEQERRRISGWCQAVRQLSHFIRNYLSRVETGSALAVKADLLRVEGVLLDRLTMLFGGETVTVTPLALTDPRAPERGGCVVIRSTNGVAYNLLWNGDSAGVRDHWRIVRVEDRAAAAKVRFDHLTVSFDDNGWESDALSEESLDEALDRLFGLAERAKSPGCSTARPLNPGGHRPAFALVRGSVEHSKDLNLNGREDGGKASRVTQ